MDQTSDDSRSFGRESSKGAGFVYSVALDIVSFNMFNEKGSIGFESHPSLLLRRKKVLQDGVTAM